MRFPLALTVKIGPLDIFRELLARGYYFTVGVEVHSSPLIQALARELPLGQLLTETDNPGGLKWLAGVVGMPSVAFDVVASLARLKCLDEFEVRRAITGELS